MIGIVAIAGQPLIRHGLHHLCVESGTLKIVGEATSLGDGLRLVDDLRPDVTILDLPRAVRCDGVGEFVGRNTAVLALLDPLPTIQLVELLRAGVNGVISRNADTAELERAVYAVNRGDLYCGPSLQNRTPRRPSDVGPAPRLTEKEAEVLVFVTAGLTNRDIAKRLCISEATAKFHVHNLIRKFGANRRIELAYLAAQQGMC